jgi:voltage-gated potassium channel
MRDRQLAEGTKYFVIIVLVIIAGAIAILMTEAGHGDGSNIKNFFDALWWSLVTITTVGYGDLYPVTFWGRIIGIIFILLGFVLFSIFTAVVASSLIDRKIKERKGLYTIKTRNHIVICGWNSSSVKILEFLTRESPDQTIVLVNELGEDKISALINTYPAIMIKYIRGDFTNLEVLNKANVFEAQHVILMYDESNPHIPPSDERTIIAAHNLTNNAVEGNVSVQLREEKYLQNIDRSKIKNVVIFDEVGGSILANSTLHPDVPDFIQEVLRFKNGVGFREIAIPPEFVGREFSELRSWLLEKKKLIVLGVVSVNPHVSIENILSGDSSAIDRFIKKQFERSKKTFGSDEASSHIKIKPEDTYVVQDNDYAIVL